MWKHYVTAGHHVAVLARREDLLHEMENAFPKFTLTRCCDISDITELERTISSVLSQLHTIDIAIICAGIGELNPSLDKSQEQATISVNINGWTYAVDTIYDIFTQQNHGHLVTLTSIGGMQPTPVAPSYSASKAFQINYTKSLQQKAKGTGITVTEIRPGLVATRMAKGEGLFWVMPLEKVTAQIVKAIRRKSKCTVVTRRWRIINLLLKHFM